MRKIGLLLWLIFLSCLSIQAQHRLRIQVLDDIYARPVSNARVIVNTVSYVSNDEGRCMATILNDTAHIEFDLDSTEFKMSILVPEDTSIVITMPELVAYQAVVIHKEKSTGIIRSNSYVLDETTLKNAILPGGTFDPIHLLLKLPGISNSQEMNAGLNIRGGGAYSTSIYWNDIPIPNLSHSMGFVSLFDINAIRKIEYFTSVVSSFYGNRGSSYIKFISKEPSLIKNNTAVTASPFLVSVNSNIPIVKNKVGVNLSIRKSILSNTYNYFLIPLFTDFYDISIQTRVVLNKNNSILINYLDNYDRKNPLEFGSNDAFNDSNIYRFRSISLRHEGVIGNRLSWSNIIYFTDFENQFLKINYNFLSISTTSKEWNYKSVLSKEFDHAIYKAGIELSHNNFKNTTFLSSDSMPNKTGFESGSVFLDYSYQGRKLKFNLNQRLNNERYQSDFYALYEYRTGVEYSFLGKHKAFVGLNRFVNNKQTVSEGLIGKPNDYSFYCDYKSILPQTTRESQMGVLLSPKKVNIAVTIYQRNIQNVYDFINLFGNDYYQRTNLASGTAISKGIETATHLNIGTRSSIDVNYTYSRTKYLNNYINHGQEYAANYDRPHNGSINYTTRRKKTLWNLNFVLESGRPFTKPLFKAFYNGPGVTIYSDRNASRLPLYHRLDIGVQFNKKRSKGIERSFGIHIYNAYAHKNIYGVILNYDMNTNKYSYKYLVAFPIMPSFNYRISF